MYTSEKSYKTIKYFMTLVLMLLLIGCLGYPVSAQEVPLSKERKITDQYIMALEDGTNVKVTVFEMSDVDKENADKTSRTTSQPYNKRVYLNQSATTKLCTVTSKAILFKDTIECMNYGDENGSGAVQFIFNGVGLSVNAGSGVQFELGKGSTADISAKSLWYNGTYHLAVNQYS